MTTPTITPTADDVLAAIQAELEETEARRTRAEDEVDASLARINALTHRFAAIHAARSALAGLPSIEPDQEWRDKLIAWRRKLSEELLALPSPIRDAHTLGLQRNLSLSLRAIELGPDVTNETGYDLTTLRLGALMIESGYEVVGADPGRHYSGVLPWHGSLPEVERRIADVERLRAEAETRLADALLDDVERERRAAAKKAELDALNNAPVLKTRADGSQYLRHSDGRRVEISG